MMSQTAELPVESPKGLAPQPIPVPVNNGSWLSPGRFALILLILICAAFPDIIFGAKTFLFRDYALFGYPLAHFHRENFWHGQIPLWNPLNNCGLPYVAQWNTMVFYPLSLIYLLLPLPWSLGWFVLFHLFLAGMGMYFLAFRWSSNRLAAGLAGISFCFSGLALSFLIWPNNISALGWMPWVLLLVEKAWRGNRTDIAKAALVGATQMLSGAPEVILFTWVIAGTVCLCQLVTSPNRIALLARAAAVPALAFTLSAIQLLPFLDLLSHSQREGSSVVTQWSMPLWGWANLFVPIFRTSPSAMGVHMQPTQAWASSYYFGVPTLFLGVAAICRARKPIVYGLFLLFIASLVLALGDGAHVFAWVRKVLPVGFMRFPVKLVVVAAAVVPLLAAFAWSQWQDSNDERPKRTALFLSIAFLALIVTITALGARYREEDQAWSTVLANGGTRALLLVSFLGLSLALHKVTTARSQIWLQLGLLATVWIDLLTHLPRQNPSVDAQAYRIDLPSLAQMQPRPEAGHSRAGLTFRAIDKFHTTILSNRFQSVIGHRMGLYDNCNLIEGLAKVDGFYSLYLPREQQVRFRLYLSTNEVREGLADFMGVSHITSEINLLDWQPRKTWMPMITAGQQPIFANDDATLKALLDGFNPRNSVYVPLDAKSAVPFTNGTAARVLSQKIEAHRITASVEAAAPALVVIAQSFYHRWKPTVDGQPTPLLRANHAFQALFIPAGRHEVQLVYDDPAFHWGALISGASLLLCLGLALPRLAHRSHLRLIQDA